MNTLQRRMLILFATLMLAVSAILTRYTSANSMGLVFYRMLFSVILTAPLVLFALCRGTLGKIDPKRIGFCMLSGVILALHFFTFFESLRFTSIASNLVLINTSVFFTAGIMFVLFGERISRKATGAIFVTFGGSVIIAISDLGGSNNEFWGDILAVIGALLFSIYTIIGGKVRSTVTTVHSGHRTWRTGVRCVAGAYNPRGDSCHHGATWIGNRTSGYVHILKIHRR